MTEPAHLAPASANAVTAESPGGMRRIATASFIGTAIEFYDYYIYGTAAALVLNEAFFPELSKTAGTLATLSTFAIGFAARPIGAAVFGHYGDRVGRKTVLVVSLLMMGLSTGLIGLLPGYATLGVWAPVLLVLLRVIQGLGLGGEWGGAALLAVEHAPKKKRGLYAAAPQMGSPVGYFAATVTFLLMSSVLDDGAFESWGWRIPFLLSFVLVAVGLAIRLKISETPAFAKVVEERGTTKAPLVEAFRRHPKEMLLGAGMITVVYVMFYTAATYCMTYTTGTLEIPKNDMLGLTLVAVVVLGVSTFLVARWSDRVGRRKLIIAGAAFGVVWGAVLFPLLDTRNYVLIAVALSGALLCMGIIYGPAGAYMPELFGTNMRYSGAGFSYNLGGVLGGAAAPLIVTALAEAYSPSVGGWFMSAMALVSLACVLALPETAERDLDKV
ncbi:MULTISPECIES: MFS transporter [unclassified Streptomyces]|uniref:MFS transporter n=1 Tax=unclassified Streptomyces TaxID=2593676 RepID=UPI001C9C0F90|nr:MULTISPECIES: MFS transporter [unclassified Streptomyces]WSQ81447.1 MHS family MFS transporter [Streptomyces sp. NBC_01213]WSQ88774.1 MHS family MFS transporter [Streptomyces sp. NBC_01212]WSR52169.1 MHS family MFS transporter [Streptomyces sp. NBC_01201]